MPEAKCKESFRCVQRLAFGDSRTRHIDRQHEPSQGAEEHLLTESLCENFPTRLRPMGKDAVGLMLGEKRFPEWQGQLLEERRCDFCKKARRRETLVHLSL